MLDATEALILAVGTANTTLKEVGEKAGYSRGLAHARFGNKEALFLRLAERSLERWIDALTEAASDKQGLDALLSRFDAVVSYFRTYPEAARVLYVLWFEAAGSATPMTDRLRDFHAAARSDIERLITQAQGNREIPKSIDPETFAIHFTSTLFGMSYQWLVNPRAIAVDEVVEALREQMERMLQG